MNRRGLMIANALKGGLPGGYTAVNYLQGTGTQYINTGIDAVNGYIISLTLDNMTNSSGLVFAVLSGNERKGLGLQSNNGLSFQYATTYTNVGSVLTANVMNDVECKYDNRSSYLKVNGTIATQNTDAQNSIALPYFLFCRNNGGSPAAYVNCKIGAFAICNQQNEAVINLIPCLDNNNVPCFYDTVSKNTFYNAGSGTFQYG